jgi:hypothetical protein
MTPHYFTSRRGTYFLLSLDRLLTNLPQMRSSLNPKFQYKFVSVNLARTRSMKKMNRWLTPLNPTTNHLLDLSFGKASLGLRIWGRLTFLCCRLCKPVRARLIVELLFRLTWKNLKLLDINIHLKNIPRKPTHSKTKESFLCTPAPTRLAAKIAPDSNYANSA